MGCIAIKYLKCFSAAWNLRGSWTPSGWIYHDFSLHRSKETCFLLRRIRAPASPAADCILLFMWANESYFTSAIYEFSLDKSPFRKYSNVHTAVGEAQTVGQLHVSVLVDVPPALWSAAWRKDSGSESSHGALLQREGQIKHNININYGWMDYKTCPCDIFSHPSWDQHLHFGDFI